jgi:hypothetical protein
LSAVRTLIISLQAIGRCARQRSDVPQKDSMDTIFKSLRKSGSKVVELDQMKHLPKFKHRDPQAETGNGRFSHADFRHLDRGICAGLTVGWLTGKLNKSDAAFHRGPRNFMRGLNKKEIGEIMHPAAELQLEHVYESRGIVELLETKDIESKYWNLDTTPDRTRPDPGRDPGLIASDFCRVCDEMAPGSAVLMRCTVKSLDGKESAGHALGLYKSERGNVQFFDANVGAYRIDKPDAFIREWMRVYRLTFLPVVMGGPDGSRPDGFYRCMLASADTANGAGAAGPSSVGPEKSST